MQPEQLGCGTLSLRRRAPGDYWSYSFARYCLGLALWPAGLTRLEALATRKASRFRVRCPAPRGAGKTKGAGNLARATMDRIFFGRARHPRPLAIAEDRKLHDQVSAMIRGGEI